MCRESEHSLLLVPHRVGITRDDTCKTIGDPLKGPGAEGPGVWGPREVTRVLDLDGPWKVKEDGNGRKRAAEKDVILMNIPNNTSGAVAPGSSSQQAPTLQTWCSSPSTMETRK